MQGDPTRGGFQGEVIFKLRLDGCVAITWRTGVGVGRAFQAEQESEKEQSEPVNQRGARGRRGPGVKVGGGPSTPV